MTSRGNGKLILNPQGWTLQPGDVLVVLAPDQEAADTAAKLQGAPGAGSGAGAGAGAGARTKTVVGRLRQYREAFKKGGAGWGERRGRFRWGKGGGEGCSFISIKAGCGNRIANHRL